jgi:hypothetical protein
MEHKYWFLYTLLLVYAGTVALDVTIQTFKESPGLYYDHLGEAQLYNTEWKVIFRGRDVSYTTVLRLLGTVLFQL